MRRLQQNHAAYSAEDHEVWQLLFLQQQPNIQRYACNAFKAGLIRLGMTEEALPKVEDLNRRLGTLTGWEIEVVEGLVPDRDFFQLLDQRRFPATTWVRSKAQLNYVEAPDIFHDVFGHVPLLTESDYVHFLEELARVAMKFIDNPLAIKLLSRLYWFTVEFGLIEEFGRLKLYGAGLMSSPGEAVYSVESDRPLRVPFSIPMMFNIHYLTHEYQPMYFVLEGFDQLFNSIGSIEPELRKTLRRWSN